MDDSADHAGPVLLWPQPLLTVAFWLMQLCLDGGHCVCVEFALQQHNTAEPSAHCRGVTVL
jgi:hypothetical protein